MSNRVIFEDGTSSGKDPASTEKLGVTTHPPWIYQGEDGNWYSDYDPSAPPRPNGEKRWTEANPFALPLGSEGTQVTLPEQKDDPTIPTAFAPALRTIGAPSIKTNEDMRQSKSRFRTSSTSGLGLIGGS